MPKSLSDADLFQAFDTGTFDPKIFSHEMHIHVGWIYACRFPPGEAVTRFADRLKAWAKALGISRKYHETITWFFMLLICERQSKLQAASFADFIAVNQDLIGKDPGILSLYYKPETLASEHARQHYVLPDRLAAPSQAA